MLYGSEKKTQSGLLQALTTRGFAVAGAIWTPLLGGRTNKSWRVDAQGQSIVVKLFRLGGLNPLFPNDPTSEVIALRHLAGLKLAPAFLDEFLTEEGHCVIYQHVPGQIWQDGSSEIAELLYRVHNADGLQGLRKVPDGSDAIVAQTNRILDCCPQSRAQHLRALKPAGMIPPCNRFSFLHGDPVPGNIVGAQGAWWLIDWQCPALGDPCEDIALFLSPAMQLAYRGTPLTDTERQTFLSAYPNQELIKRYLSLAGFYHWRMAAYCLWLESQGDRSARDAADAEIAALAAADG